MKTDIMKFINKHQLLEKNATVLVGVSGGPDSMALLHILNSLREKWNLRLIVLSVDHQLRGDESKEDVQYVQDMCKRWNVDIVTTAVDVRAFEKEHNVSTQVAARELRYHFFHEQMRRFDADYLALGHHGDDQVETMLMLMTRSASSSALSGIPVKRLFGSGFIVRPFLIVSKEQIVQYCREKNIHPRIDPSNKNVDDTRVYFRKKVIPIIKEKNNNIHTTIQYLSESLQEDEAFLQKEAEKIVNNVVLFEKKEKSASFKIDQFKSYAHALQRRAFHLILNYLYNGKLPKGLSYVHENSFFTLIKEQSGTATLNFPRQLIIEQSYGTVSVYFEEKKTDNQFQEKIIVPGKIILPDGAKLLAQVVSERKRNVDDYTYFCAKEAVTLPLHIRTRLPGDRMSWKGLNGSKKIKDVFIDEKVPRDERDSWPIVVDQQGKILWIVGLKKGAPEHLNKSTSWIQLQFEKGNNQE